MGAYIIAIAGGSCSGKTRLARHTLEALGSDTACILRQDNYYLDLGGVKPGDPLPNFDHPMAFDWELLLAHLRTLAAGQAVAVPTYDFASHRRTAYRENLHPRPIILVEGILILSQPALLPAFDYKFYVECDEATRLARRLKRDVAERGRTPESVRAQFSGQVVPMHEKFVSPSKSNADIIITQDQCALEIIHESGPVIKACRALLAH